MSTAQVVNSGIVGTASRMSQARGVASSMPFVDPLAEAYAPPARDQARNFDEDHEGGGDFRRRRRSNYQYDQVVSFGGVLVSREVGATIMQAQAALNARSVSPLAAEAERGIAIYEFNQALMGSAEAVTDVGIAR